MLHVSFGILEREFFHVVSQKGSHAKMVRKFGGKKVITIIPQHSELARGTLRRILKLSQIEEEDFWKKVRQ
ncbi:MAG: type II toxin-antitoxin system HicA family toxin [Patescibacteria group bacterium]